MPTNFRMKWLAFIVFFQLYTRVGAKIGQVRAEITRVRAKTGQVRAKMPRVRAKPIN